ncbi:sensor histidine kinase [Oricola sp.]|uniref:sensor histidine kinase n=1 Tax=Oricola sp. TaxID=1979950 RepID=UPI003BA87681
MAAVIVVSAVCLLVSVHTARQWAGERAYRELRGIAEESLALQIEALAGVMEKYRLIPALLAKRGEVRALFDEAGRQPDAALLRVLRHTAAASGARDIAIADHDGNVLVSSGGLVETATIANSRLPSVVAQRRLGRAALRLRDGSRAYAFAVHVAANDTTRATSTGSGMVFVMVPFWAIEANWSLSSNPIFVTDANEFVFLSNQRDWVGKPWQASAIAPDIAPLSFGSGRFARVPTRDDGQYVEAASAIPLLDWTLHVLVDSGPIAAARRNAAWLAALAVSLAAVVTLFVLAVQTSNQARIRREQAQSMRLERLVRDRTAELSDVNRALRDEIEVRRQTEKQLRDTQSELVHAAKLAVVGQMSATLSHEYNQPLAAIRTYAGNARKMIERDKLAGVPGVLERIEQMVERMSALSKTLLAFSRKPGTMLAPVPVEHAISDALLLVGQKAKKAGVAVTVDVPDEVIAHSGRLRLSQIIVNLVGNAVDALTLGEVTAPAGAAVAIAARHAGDHVVIEIADNGPGIEEADLERIFDPFFTTKPVGAGLGLGLSIVDSIVRDLKGSVRAESRTDGPGARFVVKLPAAEIGAEAAE